jgi:hypothetical protein
MGVSLPVKLHFRSKYPHSVQLKQATRGPYKALVTKWLLFFRYCYQQGKHTFKLLDYNRQDYDTCSDS